MGEKMGQGQSGGVNISGGRLDVGGDIVGGDKIVVGLPYDQLPAVLAAARQPWDELSDAQQGVIIELEGRLGGVAQRAIHGFFRDLGEAEVPLEQLPQRLAEMAEDHKRLKAHTAVSPEDLPEVATLKAEADKALDAGERERAEALLTQLRDLKQAAARKRRAAAEALLAAENRDLLEAAGYEASLGDLAMTRLRYRKASTHFREAAEMVPEAERDTRLGYLDRAAEALYRQGNEFGDNQALKEAALAFRAALQEYTRERVPLQWAGTQNDLGVVLRILGEREPGTQRLEEAVVAFQAALQEYTRERVPLQWAGTQTGLGFALWTLGARTSDPAKLAEAREAVEDAFEVFMLAGQEQHRSYFEESLSELDRQIAELTPPR